MRTSPFTFKFVGFNGYESVCNLQLAEIGDSTVVIASERADNDGTSITNAAESLVRQVIKHFSFDPTRLIWIEHYPAGDDCPETWDLVHLSTDEHGRFTRPDWVGISEDVFSKLMSGGDITGDINTPIFLMP